MFSHKQVDLLVVASDHVAAFSDEGDFEPPDTEYLKRDEQNIPQLHSSAQPLDPILKLQTKPVPKCLAKLFTEVFTDLGLVYDACLPAHVFLDLF